MYIDTHAHLTDKKFVDIESVVSNYEIEKVSQVITMACNVNDAVDCKTLAERFDSVYFGVGIHPQDIRDVKDSDLEKIKNLATHQKCVCIGEIGLDYYWDKTYNDIQKENLVKQLEMAKSLKLPFSFHSREATFDTINLLKENRDKLVYGGVLHCFSGSVETLKEVLNLGLKIGIGGTATFKNAKQIKENLKHIPLDAILTETDCPYLAPEPFRGTVNQPKNIPIIVEFIANQLNLEKERLAEIIYKNSSELFAKLVNAKQSQK